MPQEYTTVTKTKTKTRTAIKVGIGLAALGALAYLFVSRVDVRGGITRRLPDLVIPTPRSPRLTLDRLVFTVSNRGGALPSSLARVSYRMEWLREDYTLASRIGRANNYITCGNCLPGLEEGGSTIVFDSDGEWPSHSETTTARNLVSNPPPDARYFRISIDPNNDIVESDEGNNEITVAR